MFGNHPTYLGLFTHEFKHDRILEYCSGICSNKEMSMFLIYIYISRRGSYTHYFRFCFSFQTAFMKIYFPDSSWFPQFRHHLLWVSCLKIILYYVFLSSTYVNSSHYLATINFFFVCLFKKIQLIIVNISNSVLVQSASS